MQIELKRLYKGSKGLPLIKKINKEAFPDCERVSINEFFIMEQKSNAEFLVIYDKETPVGFILTVKNEECAYLFFLAINKNKRSNGYGGKALKALAERYANLQIILDFEEIDQTADNFLQRIKRKDFYLKNGFHETGRYTLMNSVRFEVVCNKAPLNEAAFKRLLPVLHQNCPSFANALL